MTNDRPTSASAIADETTAEHLRRRADHLCELAAKIERLLVLTMGDLEPAAGAPPRQLLGDRMLHRNLHQLHQAADDVRATAHHFRQQAARFEATSRSAA